MSFLDGFKIPDMSKVGETLQGFIKAANEKIDAQTTAVQFLAQQVKKQNDMLQFHNDLLTGIAALAGVTSQGSRDAGAVHPRHEPAGSGGVASIGGTDSHT